MSFKNKHQSQIVGISQYAYFSRVDKYIIRDFLTPLSLYLLYLTILAYKYYSNGATQSTLSRRCFLVPMYNCESGTRM
jgi:hypothetical protein